MSTLAKSQPSRSNTEIMGAVRPRLHLTLSPRVCLDHPITDLMQEAGLKQRGAALQMDTSLQTALALWAGRHIFVASETLIMRSGPRSPWLPLVAAQLHRTAQCPQVTLLLQNTRLNLTWPWRDTEVPQHAGRSEGRLDCVSITLSAGPVCDSWQVGENKIKPQLLSVVYDYTRVFALYYQLFVCKSIPFWYTVTFNELKDVGNPLHVYALKQRVLCFVFFHAKKHTTNSDGVIWRQLWKAEIILVAIHQITFHVRIS